LCQLFYEREKIECEIDVTDEKIDDIVYGLYGVTEEEREIVDDSGKGELIDYYRGVGEGNI
jgi:hypothetical protein